ELRFQVLEGRPRIGARYDESGGDLLITHPYARRAASRRDDRRRGAATNLDAGHRGQGLRELAPRGPKHARGTSHVMMQEVEGGARRSRALPQVPDPRGTEDAFQRVVLEPVVEQIRDRHRENADQV